MNLTKVENTLLSSDKKSLICSLLKSYFNEDSGEKQVENCDPQWITIPQACKITCLSRWTISKWLKKQDKMGKYLIVWYKTGKAGSSPVRIDRASFMAFLASMTVKANDGKEVM